MTSPQFSITDRATWPEILTAVEVAAIFRRAVGGVKKSCQEHAFRPAPFQSRPWLWRRTDLLTFLDAQRTQLRKVG